MAALWRSCPALLLAVIVVASSPAAGYAALLLETGIPHELTAGHGAAVDTGGTARHARGAPAGDAGGGAEGEAGVPGLLRGLLLVGAVSLADTGLYDAVHRHPDPTRRAVFGAITHLGDGLTALGLTLGLRAYDRETADAVGTAALRAGLVTTALKLVINRPRPQENPSACAPGFSLHACVSMPSGHAATAFSVARVLAHQYPDYSLLWYALAALAAWSRVEVGAHWPSDVLAGALIGLWAADTVLSQLGGDPSGRR